MRHLIWRFLFLAILLAGTWKSNAQSSLILLRRVTVIDAAGGPARRDVDVQIRGDHIERIARVISAPPGATIIQAAGKFLIPGLWDMHVHIWDADLALPLFLANGVTGVRNMGGHPDDLKRWRMELREGRRLGPQLIACGPVVDGPPPIHPDHAVVVENAIDARSAVDHLRLQGWDFTKVYDNVPRDAYFALAAEAKKDGIPFVGHVPLAVTAREAMAGLSQIRSEARVCRIYCCHCSFVGLRHEWGTRAFRSGTSRKNPAHFWLINKEVSHDIPLVQR